MPATRRRIVDGMKFGIHLIKSVKSLVSDLLSYKDYKTEKCLNVPESAGECENKTSFVCAGAAPGTHIVGDMYTPGKQ